MKKIIVVLCMIFVFVIFENIGFASSPINLDLSAGSIVIEGNKDGTTTYIQNNTYITGSNSYIIRQSDSSSTTANTLQVNNATVEITIINLNIESETAPISVLNNAKLYLDFIGDNNLKATQKYYAGIQVEQGNTIEISGTGNLVTSGGIYGAGIGGGYLGSAGTIIINGGTVVANGGKEDAAGIGGGNSGDGGQIIINDGVITATAGNYGAGIGGGGSQSAYGGNGGNGAVVTINGGKVTAVGGNHGNGIGGGNSYFAESGSGGSVNISNAEVIAKGYYCGIGGKANEYGCESINITNSNMTVSHSYANGKKYVEKIYNATIDLKNHSGLLGNFVYPSTNATGASEITYQWQMSKNNSSWSNIENQTSETANIQMTNENDGCFYRCKVTNGWGNTVYTDATQCFILDFSKHPDDVCVNDGDITILDVESISNDVTYRWEHSIDGGKSYTKLKDEIYSTLIINADLSENDVLYRCVITADNGDSLASNAAKITVATPDVYYTEKFYLQNANNDDYAAVTQNVVVSESGTSVIASNKEYNGFVENVLLGKHSGTVASDSSLILERYYDRNTYTITFDTNGGVVLPELTAKYGADILLPTPSRYGYSFEGWYTDSNLTYKADILTMPIDGATLYAKWNSQSSSSRGTEYKINALTLRNPSNYEEIKSIPASNFIAEISVTNLSSVYTDTIIVATYDENGALIDLTYMYASVDIGETTALGTLIKNTNGNISKVKAFVWSTLNSLRPLADSVEICK